MLLAASFFVLAVAAVTHRAYVVTENGATLMSADLPDQTNHPSSGHALLKARIGFALRIGTQPIMADRAFRWIAAVIVSENPIRRKSLREWARVEFDARLLKAAHP